MLKNINNQFFRKCKEKENISTILKKIGCLVLSAVRAHFKERPWENEAIPYKFMKENKQLKTQTK